MSPAKKVPIILAEISRYYGFDPETVCNKSAALKVEDPEIVEARQLAMWMVRRHTDYTIKWISTYFGYSYNNAAIELMGKKIETSTRLFILSEKISSQLTIIFKNHAA